MITMTNDLYIGVFGRNIVVIVLDEDGNALDISASTARKFRVEKPDKAMVYWTASLVTDGTDGKLYYKIIDDDLDIPGTWRIQTLLTSVGIVDPSSIGSFVVKESLTEEE